MNSKQNQIFENNPILVSGGDGFIGKNLVNKLLSTGHNVIVIDNHVTSYPRNNFNHKG
jgi:nucleoside-diphosphate-sugar epimerase